jgi:hypothetical protein
MRLDIRNRHTRMLTSEVYIATLLDPNQKDRAFLRASYNWDTPWIKPGDNAASSYTVSSWRIIQVFGGGYTNSVTKYDYAVSELRKLYSTMDAGPVLPPAEQQAHPAKKHKGFIDTHVVCQLF